MPFFCLPLLLLPLVVGCGAAPQCWSDNCTVSVQADEVCGDGVDNDGDGLSDCEDGDCFVAESCAEVDCLDGIDNDDDALSDCIDDDCWGTALCEMEAAVRLHHGYGSLFQHERVVSSDWDGSTWHRRSRDAALAVASVTGSVQIGLPGAEPFTCQWAVDGGWWSTTHHTSGSIYTHRDRHSHAPIHWSGFQLSPACPLPLGSSVVLPRYLSAHGKLVDNNGLYGAPCETSWFSKTSSVRSTARRSGTSIINVDTSGNPTSQTRFTTIERRALFVLAPGETFDAASSLSCP